MASRLGCRGRALAWRAMMTIEEAAGQTAKADDDLAASQARLNEIVAGVIRAALGDSALITRALEALRRHNWASGFPFEGSPTEGTRLREAAVSLAVSATRLLESKKRADAALARREAKSLSARCRPTLRPLRAS